MESYFYCPLCGEKHNLLDYVDEEDLKGSISTSCIKCDEIFNVEYNIDENNYEMKANKGQKYKELIECVEDIEGINSYVISSDEPITEAVLDDFCLYSYIGISRFELLCNLYNLNYNIYFEYI